MSNRNVPALLNPLSPGVIWPRSSVVGPLPKRLSLGTRRHINHDACPRLTLHWQTKQKPSLSSLSL